MWQVCVWVCVGVSVCGLCGRYLLSARAKTALKTFYASPNVDNVVRVWCVCCFGVRLSDFEQGGVIGLYVRGLSTVTYRRA
jgi:hypothetical protein